MHRQRPRQKPRRLHNRERIAIVLRVGAHARWFPESDETVQRVDDRLVATVPLGIMLPDGRRSQIAAMAMFS